MSKAKSRPAISIRVPNSEPGITMTVEAATMDDEPIIKILNKKTGTTNTLPYADRGVLDNDSFRLIDYDIQEEREKYRIKLYHPMNYLSDLVSSPAINDYATSWSNHALETLVRSQDKDKTPSSSNYEKYIPYLVWRKASPSQWGEPQYQAEEGERRNTKVRLPSGQNGWVLYLTGLERLPLGFAKWNDEANIIKLAESMYNADSLKNKALKLYPEQAI